ncbi:Acid phosphatase-like protein 2 [Mortierella alpina]|nr:Acid phosphatase-like protein 2 [Mortierella alpina]
MAVLITQAAAQPSARGLYSDYNYCQGITPVAHKTYKPVENATLRKVQVMMRHGDRTPSEVLPGDKTNYNICSQPAEYDFMASNDQQPHLRKTSSPFLKSNIVVSEEENLYAAKSYWRGNCEVGQLTNRGSAQTKQVGKHLRAIYVDQLHFLPRDLNPDDLYVRNTYVWRTKESAANFLTGLYPPHRRGKTDAVLTLNTYPEAIETLVLNRSACPRLKQLYEAFPKTPTYTEHMKHHQALLQKVNSVLGVSHLARYNASMNGDFVVPRYCNNLPLGCSAQDPASCLTAKEVVKAVSESNYGLSGLFRYGDSAEEVKRLAVGPFLKSFSASIRATVTQNNINGSSSSSGSSSSKRPHRRQRVRPFEFYSAHDQSLDQVLSVIADPKTPWPAYASTLIFETWTTTKTKKDVIRVLYEGKVVPAHPKLTCTLDACPLETFLQFIESYIPTDIHAECLPM